MTAMHTPSTPAAVAPLRHRSGRRHHALALAVAALVAAPAAQALDSFTGIAPVYVGAWFNGTFTEVQEFQFALDWAGWCNARANATCTAHRYWNANGNWDTGAVPGGGSDVRVAAGKTVRIGAFNSIYQGSLSDVAFAAVLSAEGRVELYGRLSVGNASFADLYNDRDNAGTLVTSGLSTVSLLSSGAGRFEGVGGTTRIAAFTPSPVNQVFEPLVGGGHTLQFSGVSVSTPLAVRLQPGARFVNTGTLDMGGGSVGLQGVANFAQLPVFVNQAQLHGSGTISGLKFNNAGTVFVGAGQALAIGNWGEHSGNFTGLADSRMSFVGIGSAGHRFDGGLNSLGAIDFGVGNHVVRGSFSAASSSLNTAGTLTFEGARAQIGHFELGGGGSVALRTASGAAINQLVINGDFTRFDVESGAPLDLQGLQLLRGSVNVRAPVTLASSMEWATGIVVGNEPVTSTATWRLTDGDRIFRGNVSSSGNLSWEGGRFTEWSGRFVNQTGAQFDLLGDFSSAGGAGGKLVNIGRLSKLAGTGTSTLAMGVDTIGGSVRALSGTLVLSGGGTHTDARFEASPGAAIALAGGTSFGGVITVTGPLHLSGGDFTLLSNASYQHAAGNRFDAANVSIQTGAHLGVTEDFRSTGNVSNLGRFSPASHVSIGGDFDQQGSFALIAGKALYVAGTFTNSGPLTVSDAHITVGTTLRNLSSLNVTGGSAFHANGLDNRGTLVLGPANGWLGTSAFIGGGTNSGSIRVDGNQVSVSAYDLQNAGTISNEGSWFAGRSFDLHTGALFDNNGTLALSGTTTLLSGATLVNGGTVTLQDGLLAIAVGAQLVGTGQFVQQDGETRANGRLQALGGIRIDGGVLRGTGTLEGQLVIGAGAQWKPGNSPGTMTVLGGADMLGALEIEIDSSSVHDRVVADYFNTSDTSIIHFVLGPSYQPQMLDTETIDWLSTTNLGGLRSATTLSGLPSQWTGSLADNGALVLNNTLAVQIPLRGSHAIAAGEVQFNALGRATGNEPLLDQLHNAGYLHNRAGASAGVAGMLRNASGAILINRGDLSAGTLHNTGQVHNRSGALLHASTLSNSGSLVNDGSLQVFNDFSNDEGAVLDQRGAMQVNGLSNNRGKLLVSGQLTYSFGFNNSGDVNIESTGAITGGPGSYFWHSAGILRVDGVLAADDIRVFGGSLNGNGALRGNLTTDSPVAPGNSIGVFTVQGSLDARGGLDLEIASATAFDRLVVTGDATVHSATVYLIGNYRPTVGDSFSFLSVGGSLHISNPLNWVVLRQVDADDPMSGWTTWANPDGLFDASLPADWRAQFQQGTLRITAVPEPGSWALLLAGLGWVRWVVQVGRRSKGRAQRA